MPEIERFLPGTKVSDWATPGIAASIGKLNMGSGYVGSGSGYTVNIMKMPFDTETIANISAEMEVGYAGAAAHSNSGSDGYIAGGYNHPLTPRSSDNIDKLLYADDTASLLSAELDQRRTAAVGMSNSGTAGYVCGGDIDGTNTPVHIVEKFIYANGTNSELGTTLTHTADTAAAFSHKDAFGFVVGGYSIDQGGGAAGYLDEIDKWVFSSDTRSAMTDLPGRIAWLDGFSDSGVSGYIGGGWHVTSQNITTIYKWAYSNDTRSTSSATMSVADSQHWGFANSGIAGYFGGGYSGGARWVDRYAFTTDTRSSMSDMPGAQNSAAGFSNEGSLL